MNQTIKIVIPLLMALLMNTGGLFAQDSTKSPNPENHRPHFVDKDGDGYNDNAPDHDGDGIPNGLDPDYQKAQKQKGRKKQKFIDLNGDGIDDNLMRGNQKRQHGTTIDPNDSKNQGKALDERDKTKQRHQQKKGNGKN